jgi:hypothetical protein
MQGTWRSRVWIERKPSSCPLSSSTGFDMRKVRPESLTAWRVEVCKRRDQDDFLPHDLPESDDVLTDCDALNQAMQVTCADRFIR